ncbi:MAG: DNA repair protein RadA [Clostridia bacterium]|nr:DNA repair protein RadA [Clostridia bacterium]MBR2431823.1 DNA repair protein RadA [Clostridia bacterium]MBR3714799.1 DNA repair protein RadA [Clostridia bacterium]
MKQPKSYYECSECGYRSAKWMGRCPSCGEWNTLEEHITQSTSSSAASRSASVVLGESRAVRFSELEMPEYMRSLTGMGELDRVLGGGIVDGSAVLIAGEPGIGKSTLLMQICGVLGQSKKVLYVSGEESSGQLKYRANRLGVSGDMLYIMTETSLERILGECENISPDFLVVDSIQTMFSDSVSASAGSLTQVKECASRFISMAKTKGVVVLMVGHVNKEGNIAGPKVLEHMVDAVLSFEGDRQQLFRVIRASKNRYGSTNEIGVFEMTGEGLCEVENPSEMLLASRPKNISGNCAVCVMEGSRPIISEIQALTSTSFLSSPRRTSNGIDYNRMYLILAVLEKRLGLRFSACDAYLNVIGGLRLDEPAADMAIALALLSSMKDIPIPDDLIAFGEVGLAGECRPVSAPEIRVNEAVRLGFTKIILPKKDASRIDPSKLPDGIELIGVGGIFDALKIFSKQ